MALHIDTSVTLSWTTADATTAKTATLTPTGGRTPVGVFALSTHDLWDGVSGWDALAINYGGVSLGSIRSQDAEAGFVSDVWVLGGKTTIAARSGNTVTVTPTGASTLAKAVLVALIYSDSSLNDAAWDSANAGGNTTSQTDHTISVTHTATLTGGWIGLGGFAQAGAPNGATGIASGNSLLTTFTFGSGHGVDYVYRDSTAAAATSTYGHSPATSAVYSSSAAVLSEVSPPSTPFGIAVSALSGLQSYWPLTSNLLDAGPGGIMLTNHGATVGGAGAAPLVLGDTASTALGATGYLTAGDNYDFTGELGQTQLIWVSIPAALTAATIILSKYDQVADTGWELFLNLAGAKLISAANYPGPAVANASDRALTPDTPMLVARSYDGAGGFLKAWVNGVQVTGTVGPTAPIADSTASLTVGARATGTGTANIVNARVAHFAIFNRELTATEMLNLWRAGTVPQPVGSPTPLVGTSVFTAATVATPTTLTPALPTARTTGGTNGYDVGDVLLCATFCRSATPTVATPSGWTSIANVTGTNGRLALFGKVATSTSESAPSVVWSSLTTGTSGTPAGAQCAAIVNVGSLTADVVGAAANGAASTATAAGGAAITTTLSKDLVLSLMTRLDDAGTIAAPATYQLLGTGATTSGSDFSFAWATLLKEVAGSVSAPNFALTGASSFASSGIQVALKATVVPVSVGGSDTGTATDARTTAAASTVTESATATDASSLAQIQSITVTEAPTATDASSLARASTVVESGSATEGTSSVPATIGVTDTGTTTDVRTSAIGSTVVETGTETDASSSVVSVVANESASATDVAALAGTLPVSVTDSLTASDASSVSIIGTPPLDALIEDFSGTFPGSTWSAGSTATVDAGTKALKLSANLSAITAGTYNPQGSQITATFDASNLVDASTYLRVFTTPGSIVDYVTTFVEFDSLTGGYRLRMLEAINDVTQSGATTVLFDGSKPVQVRLRHITSGSKWEWSWRQDSDWMIVRTATAVTTVPTAAKVQFRATSNQIGYVLLDDVNVAAQIVSDNFTAIETLASVTEEGNVESVTATDNSSLTTDSAVTDAAISTDASAISVTSTRAENASAAETSSINANANASDTTISSDLASFGGGTTQVGIENVTASDNSVGLDRPITDVFIASDAPGLPVVTAIRSDSIIANDTSTFDISDTHSDNVSFSETISNLAVNFFRSESILANDSIFSTVLILNVTDQGSILDLATGITANALLNETFSMLESSSLDTVGLNSIISSEVGLLTDTSLMDIVALLADTTNATDASLAQPIFDRNDLIPSIDSASISTLLTAPQETVTTNETAMVEVDFNVDEDPIIVSDGMLRVDFQILQEIRVGKAEGGLRTLSVDISLD